MVFQIIPPRDEEEKNPSLMTYGEITQYMTKIHEKYNSLPIGELETMVKEYEKRGYWDRLFDPQSAIIDYWVAIGIVEERKGASA